MKAKMKLAMMARLGVKPKKDKENDDQSQAKSKMSKKENDLKSQMSKKQDSKKSQEKAASMKSKI